MFIRGTQVLVVPEYPPGIRLGLTHSMCNTRTGLPVEYLGQMQTGPTCSCICQTYSGLRKCSLSVRTLCICHTHTPTIVQFVEPGQRINNSGKNSRQGSARKPHCLLVAFAAMRQQGKTKYTERVNATANDSPLSVLAVQAV